MVHQQMGWLRSDTVSLTHTDLGKWLAGTSQVTPVSFLPLQPPFLFFESNSVRTLTSQLKLELLASADNFALLQGSRTLTMANCLLLSESVMTAAT